MKNLLAEKIISKLRGVDTQTHRNIKFLTVNEDAIRNLFETDEYLKGLSNSTQEFLEQEMKSAEAAKRKADAKAEAERKAAQETAAKAKQKRIDERLKIQKEKEEERKKRIADSRKSNNTGAELQQNLSSLEKQ